MNLMYYNLNLWIPLIIWTHFHQPYIYIVSYSYITVSKLNDMSQQQSTSVLNLNLMSKEIEYNILELSSI